MDNSELLNDYKGYASFRPTDPYRWMIHSKHSTIALFSGNQFGKTAGVAHQYVSRVLGTHPVPKRNVNYYECINRARLKVGDIDRKEFFDKHKNKDSCTFSMFKNPGKCPECGAEIILHKRETRVFRFCSENLPGQSANIGQDGISAETRNTQYPAIKKWLPKHLIKKDITSRSTSMIIKDPFGFDDIIFEFVSYNQGSQATAGVQRISLWEDEEPPIDFREEQIPRLLAEEGDEIISLTPANYITWTYDEIFERAHVYYRTKTICDFLEKEDFRPEQVEVTDNTDSIAVIMAATDDNPTLDRDAISAIFDKIDDPDVLAIRRYGIFKQVSGRIFKDFEFQVHCIDNDKYFPDGIPHNWVHARGIDYHQQTPWACGAISLSPTNEAFIWLDYNPSPEKFTTKEIARNFATQCQDYDFLLNLIDPLSDAAKKDGVTVRDDLNSEFYELCKEGISTKTYWQNWATKGERGRDEIRKRLKNAKKVGRPFNNTVIMDGRTVNIPTIWMFKNCKLAANSMKKWRWEEYADARSIHLKGEKNVPEQKWSHMNMVWEAVFKNPAFRPMINRRHQDTRHTNYFNRAAR